MKWLTAFAISLSVALLIFVFLPRSKTVIDRVPGPTRTVIQVHRVVRWRTKTVTRTVTDPGMITCADQLWSAWAADDPPGANTEFGLQTYAPACEPYEATLRSS